MQLLSRLVLYFYLAYFTPLQKEGLPISICFDFRYDVYNLSSLLLIYFIKDKRCSSAQLQPPGTFPVKALASFPRSGNTWARQLIERATGYYTGTVYWTIAKNRTFDQISKSNKTDNTNLV